MNYSNSLPCGHEEDYKLLIQYCLTSEDYDGISEITCTKCNGRWGRWSNKELQAGELEPRYGIPKEIIK